MILTYYEDNNQYYNVHFKIISFKQKDLINYSFEFSIKDDLKVSDWVFSEVYSQNSVDVSYSTNIYNHDTYNNVTFNFNIDEFSESDLNYDSEKNIYYWEYTISIRTSDTDILDKSDDYFNKDTDGSLISSSNIYYHFPYIRLFNNLNEIIYGDYNSNNEDEDIEYYDLSNDMESGNKNLMLNDFFYNYKQKFNDKEREYLNLLNDFFETDKDNILYSLTSYDVVDDVVTNISDGILIDTEEKFRENIDKLKEVIITTSIFKFLDINKLDDVLYIDSNNLYINDYSFIPFKIDNKIYSLYLSNSFEVNIYDYSNENLFLVPYLYLKDDKVYLYLNLKSDISGLDNSVLGFCKYDVSNSEYLNNYLWDYTNIYYTENSIFNNDFNNEIMNNNLYNLKRYKDIWYRISNVKEKNLLDYSKLITVLRNDNDINTNNIYYLNEYIDKTSINYIFKDIIIKNVIETLNYYELNIDKNYDLSGYLESGVQYRITSDKIDESYLIDDINNKFVTNKNFEGFVEEIDTDYYANFYNYLTTGFLSKKQDVYKKTIQDYNIDVNEDIYYSGGFIYDINEIKYRRKINFYNDNLYDLLTNEGNYYYVIQRVYFVEENFNMDKIDYILEDEYLKNFEEGEDGFYVLMRNESNNVQDRVYRFDFDSYSWLIQNIYEDTIIFDLNTNKRYIAKNVDGILKYFEYSKDKQKYSVDIYNGTTYENYKIYNIGEISGGYQVKLSGNINQEGFNIYDYKLGEDGEYNKIYVWGNYLDVFSDINEFNVLIPNYDYSDLKPHFWSLERYEKNILNLENVYYTEEVTNEKQGLTVLETSDDIDEFLPVYSGKESWKDVDYVTERFVDYRNEDLSEIITEENKGKYFVWYTKEYLTDGEKHKVLNEDLIQLVWCNVFVIKKDNDGNLYETPVNATDEDTVIYNKEDKKYYIYNSNIFSGIYVEFSHYILRPQMLSHKSVFNLNNYINYEIDCDNEIDNINDNLLMEENNYEKLYRFDDIFVNFNKNIYDGKIFNIILNKDSNRLENLKVGSEVSFYNKNFENFNLNFIYKEGNIFKTDYLEEFTSIDINDILVFFESDNTTFYDIESEPSNRSFFRINDLYNSLKVNKNVLYEIGDKITILVDEDYIYYLEYFKYDNGFKLYKENIEIVNTSNLKYIIGD